MFQRAAITRAALFPCMELERRQARLTIARQELPGKLGGSDQSQGRLKNQSAYSVSPCRFKNNFHSSAKLFFT
jgi:hypothetical protein